MKGDGRYGSFNGGQIDHNETYLDGVGISSPSVQGDNSSINRGFSVDAVGQFQADEWRFGDLRRAGDSGGSPITNNFLAGFATGFNYEKISGKLDYDGIKKHRLGLLYTYGNRRADPLCCDSSGLPQPYTQGVGNTQYYHTGLAEDTWTVNDHTINQLKYAVNFTGGPSTNPGEGNPAWAASAAGIAGLPPGQASDAFPRTAFSGANAPLNWG